MIPITYGMVSDGRVGSALARILPLCGRDCAAIIRGIDSARSRNDLTKVLAFHDVPYDVVNGNICVSAAALQKSLELGLFTGFDEVWISSGSPPTFDLASLPSATSDATDFSSSMPGELSVAIEKTNCILVLGDGCGLNYASNDEHIQEMITKGEL